MIAIEKIREDLREIRYYYSKQKMFDSVSKTVGQSSVVDKVNRYNQAIKDAPVRLYDLYISLYLHNNSQATVAYDWDKSNDYIRELNRKLCEFLQKVFNCCS